ncbi:MAG: cation transporter [Pseudomonadales bacterium]|nr:cation transporter [Pseudomonadales bacterium]MCP5303314.1 cation transporter [Pseudomonadales bacterium]
MQSQFAENMKIAHRVTIVGMILDTFLGVGKIFIGLISSSHAVLIDGIHSLSDMVTDIFVLIITRISNNEPDREHPYGHARFEAIGTVLLGGTLIIVALVLAYENIGRAITGTDIELPTWPALVITLISIVSKEWIFHYTRRAGERLRSNLLIANAWHSRTDMFSSVVVLVGVAGAMLGVAWLDAAAAAVVALIIGQVGTKLVWDSIKELVDTGLSKEETDEIKKVIVSMEGVRSAHNLRTRQMGSDIFLDVHIRVNPRVSVSEGHQIGEWVTKRLLERFRSIKDLTYHIDAEDDRHTEVNAGETLLPLREAVIAELENCWSQVPHLSTIQKRYILHYLDDKIDIEVFFEANANAPENEDPVSLQDIAELKAALNERGSQIPWLGRIEVWLGAKL